MSAFGDYAAATLAGMRQGAAAVGRNAVADIGDSYQEVLMAHARISPADGLTPTPESAAQEQAPEPTAPAADISPPEVSPDVA